MPTKRGLMLAILASISVSISLSSPNLASSMLSSILLAILASSFLFSLISFRRIEIIRHPSEDCSVGEEACLPILIRNKSRFTRQSFVLRESIPFTSEPAHDEAVKALTPFEEIRLERNVQADRRGVHQLGKVLMLGGDPAGLFRRAAKFELPDTVTVYPSIYKLNSFPLTVRRKIHISSSKPIGESGAGQDFFGIREHRRSDGMRFICWRASVKHRKLMVKEFEALGNASIAIVLDCRRNAKDSALKSAAPFECIVSAAASLCMHLSEMNCFLLFSTQKEAGDGFSNISGSGSRFKNISMDFLASVQTRDESAGNPLSPIFEAIPPQSIVYLFSMAQDPSYEDYFSAFFEKGVELRWILACPENFSGRPEKNASGLLEDDGKFSFRPLRIGPESRMDILIGDWRQ